MEHITVTNSAQMKSVEAELWRLIPGLPYVIGYRKIIGKNGFRKFSYKTIASTTAFIQCKADKDWKQPHPHLQLFW